MLNQRGRFLRALWFLELRPAPQDTALIALRSWLNSWTGIGAVAVGMAHQDYDLQLTRYDARGWRATFYVSGTEHSLTRFVGSAVEPSLWPAVRSAAWEALTKPETHAR